MIQLNDILLECDSRMRLRAPVQPVQVGVELLNLRPADLVAAADCEDERVLEIKEVTDGDDDTFF